MYYDVIIIGSGISGLYAAYNIKKMSPSTSFIILEKYKKNWIGGRTSNDTFYGTEIVTGAGVGRKKKDKLLMNLLDELKLPYEEFHFKPYYSNLIDNIVDVKKVIEYLKTEYNKTTDPPRVTFKEFAKPILGANLYNDFLVSVGYTDYENEDAFDVIHNYGMEDNACCWEGLYVHWKQLVTTLYDKIGHDKIKTSMHVVSITKEKTKENNSRFVVETDKEITFESNKVIVATTIDSIKQILPGASNKNSLYNHIKGQTFLRLYGKFSKESSEIMKTYTKGYTIVPGPLQKITPMDANNGVYMIAYSDNANAVFLKKYLENTPENKEQLCRLIEEALGIQNNSLHLIAIKNYYWPIGTHYYTPLPNKFKSREEFIDSAQHPQDGILVVGEVVAKNQGWTHGAFSSIKAVLNKKWINTIY